MDGFDYRNGQLWCESAPAEKLAEHFGTPLYVYSQHTFQEHYQTLRAAFADLDPLICFSVKSCQNIHILNLLRELGSGFDVVSGGEVFRALHAGADPQKIVYAGVGKTDREVHEALTANIGLFNVESESECAQLDRLAQERGTVINAALRINPNVDPKTHKYTATGRRGTKFGVDLPDVPGVLRRWGGGTGLRIRGLHLHLGSPVHELAAYATGIERTLELIDAAKREGIELDTLDIGGGYGAHYQGSEAPAPQAYADVIVPLLHNRGLRVILEPGRAIAANAGVLLTRVLHLKQSGGRTFVIVDASMNELLRPALYGAYHCVWPVQAGRHVPVGRGPEQPYDDLVVCDVVGPVCESSDFLARDRQLPPVQRGDLLAVFTSGAYGIVMASQYNSRPRSAELLVNAAEPRLIRRRETYADLIRYEEETGNGMG